MINRVNKIIIVLSLILIIVVIINIINVLPEEIETGYVGDVDYNEIYCEFIELSHNQITVIIDDQQKKFEINSPYKFIGINKGTEIVLLVPKDDSKKVAIKIENESILN